MLAVQKKLQPRVRNADNCLQSEVTYPWREDLTAVPARFHMPLLKKLTMSATIYRATKNFQFFSWGLGTAQPPCGVNTFNMTTVNLATAAFPPH
jgi:hypothetical protein